LEAYDRPDRRSLFNGRAGGRSIDIFRGANRLGRVFVFLLELVRGGFG